MNPDLLLLADGRFPAGGHSWSAGVEAAVNIGDVVDALTLERYLAGRLATTATVDAAFAAASCHTARCPDGTGDGHGDRSTSLAARLGLLDREYEARTPSVHLRATSRRLGRHFARAASPIWSGPAIDAASAPPDGGHQPIVLGAVVAAAGGMPAEAAAIALHHTTTAATTAAVRLLGLDPIALIAVARRRLADVAPDPSTVTAWVRCPPAALPAAGGSLTEILGEHHGHLDGRLFVA